MSSGDSRQIVMWRSKWGCRFGYLVQEGPKWTMVKYDGRTRRWPSAEIVSWPPPPVTEFAPRKRLRR